MSKKILASAIAPSNDPIIDHTPTLSPVCHSFWKWAVDHYSVQFIDWNQALKAEFVDVPLVASFYQSLLIPPYPRHQLSLLKSFKSWVCGCASGSQLLSVFVDPTLPTAPTFVIEMSLRGGHSWVNLFCFSFYWTSKEVPYWAIINQPVNLSQKSGHPSHVKGLTQHLQMPWITRAAPSPSII